MNKIIQSGRRVINSAPCKWLGPVRAAAKKAFVGCASCVSDGARVEVGRKRKLVVPWDFVGATDWPFYEPHSVEFFAGLIDEAPDSLVVDIGCAIGIYSLVALSVSKRVEVCSMDSDMMSLAIAAHLCRPTARGRHRLLWGFCGDEKMGHDNPLRGDLEHACARSLELVKQAGLKPRIGANAYTCVGGANQEHIPFWDMDSLLVPVAKTGRPILVKVDIEGAEIAMLRGSSKLSAYPNVQMLLSVHPHILTQAWASSGEEVRELLESRDYQITLVEKTSEEHWWVRKRAGGAGGRKSET